MPSQRCFRFVSTDPLVILNEIKVFRKGQGMRGEFHSNQDPNRHTITSKLEVMLRKIGRKPAYSWGREMRRPGEYWDSHSDSLSMRVSFPRDRFVRRLTFFTILLSITTVLTMALFIVVVPAIRRTHGLVTKSDSAAGASAAPTRREVSKTPVRELGVDALISELTKSDVDEIYALELVGQARTRRIPDIDTLVMAQLNHESYAVRLEVIKIIVASRKFEHARHIVGHLIDPDPFVRATVAQGLALLGDPESAIALRSRLLIEESPEVRRAISGALQSLEK